MFRGQIVLRYVILSRLLLRSNRCYHMVATHAIPRCRDGYSWRGVQLILELVYIEYLTIRVQCVLRRYFPGCATFLACRNAINSTHTHIRASRQKADASEMWAWGAKQSRAKAATSYSLWELARAVLADAAVCMDCLCGVVSAVCLTLSLCDVSGWYKRLARRPSDI